MTLGESLRAARERKNMTLRAVARALGVSAPFWSDVEHNRRRPKELQPVAQLLGLDAKELELLKMHAEIADWARDNPKLVELLQELKKIRRRCMCPWCRNILEGPRTP